MRLGLKFREMLTGPLQVVQDELDQLIAGILGGYRLEHKLPSGLHGNITADSINLNSGGTIGGDVQITGKIDKIIPSEQEKTLEVYDFKTGKATETLPYLV